MLRLLVVQPYLTRYRIPVFAELARHYETLVVASPSGAATGFGVEGGRHGFAEESAPEVSLGRLGFWQQGVVRALLRFRPHVLLITANPRYLSFWVALLLGRLLGVAVFAHGQGLYRKKTLGQPLALVYGLMLRLATAYVCYTEASRDSFLRLGFSSHKLRVAENSLTLSATLRPQERTSTARGILFVGRLRPGNGLPLLIEACEAVRKDHDLTLHIVGGGEEAVEIAALCAGKSWITLHGQVYDEERIRDISRQCLLGVYPGDAGLSVLHYMALSLPPVAHDDLSRHMGPEPSYIRHGVNGFLYAEADRRAALTRLLGDIFADPEALQPVQAAAWETYRRVSFPSLARRFMDIFEEGRRS